ncbi:MAG: hypothetical protein JXQ96_19650 [Cyclobacteriaceae bacterium]
MKSRTICLFFAVLLLSACGDDCCLPFDDHEELIGKWILFEEGYSPANGYIVREIAPEPEQFIEFKTSESFVSNIDHIREYTQYKIIENPNNRRPLLVLLNNTLVNDTLALPVDIHQFRQIYGIEKYDSGGLRLSHLWCVEGCHLGFRKIE